AELLPALADPAVCSEAVKHLVDRGKTPLRAYLLAMRSKAGPGEEMAVEWRIVNLSPAEVELTLEESPARRLQATGPHGAIDVSGSSGAGKRTVRLGPGEFQGGGFPALAAQAKLPGRYQLAWSRSEEHTSELQSRVD